MLSYSALIEGYAIAGRVDEAAEWLQAASERGVAPNVVTYSSVAKGYASTSRLEEARTVVQAMIADGVSPNAVTYNALIACCVRDGLAGEAAELLDEMKVLPWTPRLVCALTAPSPAAYTSLGLPFPTPFSFTA